MQLDLFNPEPNISAGTTASGKPVWYCRRRSMWTLDPSDLQLTDEQLIEKYGSAF